MKSATGIFTLVLLMSIGAAARAGEKVETLTVKCLAQAHVTAVYNSKFYPGVRPQGRFPGIPASSGFDAQVVLAPASAACELLHSKYGLFIDHATFAIHISTTPVLKQPEIDQLAQTAINHDFNLHLQQYFGFQTEGGWLPLFPKVHSESLVFLGSGQLGEVALDIQLPLAPNINWIYSLTPIESISDIDKLALAEQVGHLVAQDHYGDFTALLLNLEPYLPNLKKSYAQIIWAMFHEVKATHRYGAEILRFHVGGYGSFEGAPLATKFNVISQIPGLFSNSELQTLIEEFPNWLLAGNPGSKNCLNVTSEDLEAFLNFQKQKLPVMTASEKWELKDAVETLTTKIYYGFCLQSKSTDQIKNLATEILPQLK